MAGEHGCIALQWWNAKHLRYEMRCARTGPGAGLLKAKVWYRLNASGKFEEIKDAKPEKTPKAKASRRKKAA